LKMNDTLNATFATFFGPTEDTAGTGTATRADEHGILHEVVVDEAEYATFVAEQGSKSTARADDELARAIAQADDC